MDLEDVPILGAVIGSGGVLLDLILNSGELVLSLLAVVVMDPGALLGIVSTLNRLAPRLDFLPEGVLGEVATALLVAVFVMSVVRFINSRRQNA